MDAKDIWDKVDDTLIVIEASPEPPSGLDPSSQTNVGRPPKRNRRIKRAFRAGVGLIVWLYIFLQLFVFDVDQRVFGLAPGVRHLLAYKLLFLLACLVVVALARRRLLLPFLYVVFFPAIILFWTLPYAIYKRRSGALVLGIANLGASTIVDFKWNFGCAVLWLISATIALASHAPWAVISAIVCFSLVLLRSYFRTIKYSFMPSRFVTLQTNVLTTLGKNNIGSTLAQLDPELVSDEIEKFDKQQLDKFTTKLSHAIIANRLLYLWAHQLEEYRQGILPYLFGLLSYLWLFASTLMTLSAINLGIIHITPHAFAYSASPSVVTVVFYTLASIAVLIQLVSYTLWTPQLNWSRLALEYWGRSSF
jgi:hypothetical protein